MRFVKFFAPLLCLLTVVVSQSALAQSVEMTTQNQNLFLRIQGTLRLACYLPSPIGQRVYGFVLTQDLPSGGTRDLFVPKTLGWAVLQKKKYDKSITTLMKQISQSRRDGLAAQTAQYKNTLKLRKKARQEVASLLVGCPKFLPALSDYSYPVPTPTPSLGEEECLEPSDNPFHFSANNFGLINVVPGPHTLRFHVDPEIGNDNDPGRGLTEDAPLRTIAKAKQLALQASEGNRSPHHILLARGRSFLEPFGAWNFNGLSQDEPFVLGNYGDKELRRPRLMRPLVINGNFSNIVINGLDFFDQRRFPYTPTGALNPLFIPNAPDETALTINGAVDRVLIQDSLFWYYTVGVSVTGASSSRSGQAKEITLIRNSFRDMYSHTGPARGVKFEKTNGVMLTENVFARIGNPQFLSEYYVDAGQGVGPGLVPMVDSVAAKIGPLNECYAVVRGNQFYKGPAGLDIRGFVTDAHGQLEPYTQEVEVYSNVFAELTRATLIDANAVVFRQNAFINGKNWGGITTISGADIRNASALKMYFNTFANSRSQEDNDIDGDSAINVMGHADMGYHDVHHNVIRHWPGGLRVGPLKWYDSLILPDLGGGTRNVPVNFSPRELLYHDNIIQNNDPNPLIIVSRIDRGTSNIEFARNILWNPGAPQQRLWAYKERGTISGIEVEYAPDPPGCTPFDPLSLCGLTGSPLHCINICPPPVCQSILISVSPNNRKQTVNWYTGSLLSQVNPTTGALVQFTTTGYLPPNQHRVSCNALGDFTVGAPHVLSKSIKWSKWLQYANAGGNNDPNGDRIREIEFFQPDRDLITFQTATSLRLLTNNGMELGDSLDDFIDYVTHPDIHLPAQDMSFDPRVFGKNVSQYLIVGLNDVNAPNP